MQELKNACLRWPHYCTFFMEALWTKKTSSNPKHTLVLVRTNHCPLQGGRKGFSAIHLLPEAWLGFWGGEPHRLLGVGLSVGRVSPQRGGTSSALVRGVHALGPMFRPHSWHHDYSVQKLSCRHLGRTGRFPHLLNRSVCLLRASWQQLTLDLSLLVSKYLVSLLQT